MRTAFWLIKIKKQREPHSKIYSLNCKVSTAYARQSHEDERRRGMVLLLRIILEIEWWGLCHGTIERFHIITRRKGICQWLYIHSRWHRCTWRHKFDISKSNLLTAMVAMFPLRPYVCNADYWNHAQTWTCSHQIKSTSLFLCMSLQLAEGLHPLSGHVTTPQRLSHPETACCDLCSWPERKLQYWSSGYWSDG